MNHKASILFLVIGLASAGVLGAPVEYNDEAEFLQDLKAIGELDVYSEDFESPPWDQYRSVFPETNSVEQLTVHGVTWSGNEEITTNLNWGRTGYGLYTIFQPPTLTPDEFIGTADRTMYAVGGYFDSNPDFADLVIEVNGVQIGAGEEITRFTFVGVIDPDGFDIFRIYDLKAKHSLGADDFTIALAPACPADLNGDGALDVFDVFVFLDLFNAGNASADLVPDGVLDVFDVFAYLDAFGSGCP